MTVNAVTAERLKQLPWGMWTTQALAVMRLELRRSFWNSRALFRHKAGLLRIVLLAMAPAVIFGAHSIHQMARGEACNLGQDLQIFAGVFQFFYLRLAIFFGCLGVFLGLFRGEMRERTLHYAFLTPVRREVLVVGKYLGGLIGTALIFSLGVLAALWALSWHYDWTAISGFLTRDHGLRQIGAYVVATAMACVGYGSVFLAVGVLFKNPILPAAAILLWESLYPVLPSVLQRFSVLFYLRSLSPVDVPLPHGAPAFIAMLVVNSTPIAPWIAVTGLCALTAVVLAWAGVVTRKAEIAYAAE